MRFELIRLINSLVIPKICFIILALLEKLNIVLGGYPGQPKKLPLI